MSKDANKCVYVKGYSPYVTGVIGQDIFLTFRQRLEILFSKGICVQILNERLKK